MSQPNTLWDDHLERLSRIHAGRPSGSIRTTTRSAVVSGSDIDKALRSEWNARPPGRLGRRLLADVELYLHFFAIARS
jgi:hypothetical protein